MKESKLKPMDFAEGKAFRDKTPVRQITECEFDDLEEAKEYCDRMFNCNSIRCEPVSCGDRRWKIEQIK